MFSFQKIKGIAGTSVGAIIAMALSIGFTPEELTKKIVSMDLSKFEDGSSIFNEAYHFYTKLGWYDNDALYNFIKELIREKIHREDPENVTFADLHELDLLDLHVVATKMRIVNDNVISKEKIFSYETTPDTSVATAVLASASTPFYFPRLRLKKMKQGKYVLTESKDAHVYFDGGLSNNFPIQIFDKRKYINPEDDHPEDHAINPHTLGLALRNADKIIDSHHPPVKRPVNDNHPFEMIEGIINAITNEFSNDGLMKSENRVRTIEIDRLNVPLGKFDMSSKTKLSLIKSGEKAVEEYYSQKEVSSIDHKQSKAKNENYSQNPGNIGMWKKGTNVSNKEERISVKRCILS